MGDKQREELMSSLKLLYTDGDYSDLTITCRDKHYQVHKAIVCPRSKFFSTSESARNGTVILRDEDPRAVEMVVHYLYHLDYSPISTHLEDKATSMTSYGNEAPTESEGPWKTNGHDGQGSDDLVPETMSESTEGHAPVESLDELISSVVPMSKKGKKKKKKKPSTQLITEESTVELKDSPVEEMEINDEPLAEEAIAPPPEESLTYGNLLIHAKVYTLSKKYGIEGLKTLALEKFEDEAKHKWATDDFLQAAKEVYTSTLDDDDDRGMRDVITGTLYEHRELLTKKETQKVIKGLDLGFDLLMRLLIKDGLGDS